MAWPKGVPRKVTPGISPAPTGNMEPKNSGILMGANCGNCRFLSDITCRRFPTPVTKAKDDWCGEYAAV